MALALGSGHINHDWVSEDKAPGPKVASVRIRVAHLNGCASGHRRVATALRLKLWPLEVKESRQPKSGPVWLHECYLEERKGGNVIDKNDINSQREHWLLNKYTSVNPSFSGGELFCFEKAGWKFCSGIIWRLCVLHSCKLIIFGNLS